MKHRLPVFDHTQVISAFGMFVLWLFLCASSALASDRSMLPVGDWNAEWIGVIGGNKPNTWICYRKKFHLDRIPSKARARISCDSKYWLWINGELVVFEGQLKRGPTPRDTYYDTVDLTSALKEGDNSIAVLVWHFGQHGFSHNSSGKAALLFDASLDGEQLLSDTTWKVRIHPAFGTTDPPKDNVRQPEPNIRFDARHDIGAWHAPAYDDSTWGPTTSYGKPPTGPWNDLYERPIPLWLDSGLLDYENVEERPGTDARKIVCRLPYNCHVTPYLKIRAPAGETIRIQSDIQDLYGKLRLVEVHRHEYVTRNGLQEFELLSWLNGHEIHFIVPENVEVLELKYRETGYDTEFIGKFWCDDERLNQLWQESLRTLYVTMRDTYMDCPDRERAQWWGDAVNEIGEAFYALEPIRSPQLAKKAIYELIRWQRDDHTLYSPVPSGIRRPGIQFPLDGSWDQELPQQMLASVGWYGFWNYYWYSGDEATIRDAYPAVKRYLSLWHLGDDGLVIHRPGGWDWTDWGSNIDVPVIENAWYYLALKSAVAMARLSDNDNDVVAYKAGMRSIEDNYHSRFWQGGEYRSPGYEGETDDRANAMAVIAGLAPENTYADISTVLETQQHASPYMEKYVLEALMLMNRPEIAQRRMRTRYASMLGDSQTTLWELFGELTLDGFGSLGNGTYNHAWSGGPLTILSQYVAGVAPTKPAFREFAVGPQMGDLKKIETVVPTLFGEIQLEMSCSQELPFQLHLAVPEGTDASVGIPRQYVSEQSSISINGKPVWRSGSSLGSDLSVASQKQNDLFVLFSVPAGEWSFEVSSGK